MIQRAGSVMAFSILFQVDVFHPNTDGSAWIFQTPLFLPAVQHGGPWKKQCCSIQSMGPDGAGIWWDHGSSLSTGKPFLYTVTKNFVFSVWCQFCISIVCQIQLCLLPRSGFAKALLIHCVLSHHVCTARCWYFLILFLPALTSGTM